jgi:hypothetical protein
LLGLPPLVGGVQHTKLLLLRLPAASLLLLQHRRLHLLRGLLPDGSSDGSSDGAA